jgi:hypothetical protein
MKKETDVQKIVKGVRSQLGLTQTELGKKIWPRGKKDLVKLRIAKYELGYAIPPGDVLLRIMRLPHGRLK